MTPDRHAEIAKRASTVVGSDAPRQRTLSDRISGVDERESVQNVEWSAARVA